MLVGPCRVSASLVNHAEDAVGADEIPRENRIAAVIWIAHEFLPIDGVEAAIGQRCAPCAAVQLGLVDVDAFFIFGGGTGGSRERGARAGRNPVASGFRGCIKISRVRHVVVNAGERRASACDDRSQSGK